MALWFKKKIEKGGDVSSTKVEEVTSPAVAATDSKPTDPPPVAPRSTMRQPVSFKIPQAAVQNKQMQEPQPRPAASSVPNQVKPSDGAAVVQPKPPVPEIPPVVPTSPTISASVPVSRENGTTPEARPVLKPVEIRAEEAKPSKGEEAKPAIRVADKTAVSPEKIDPIAADKPALPRSDPKVLYYQLMNGLYDVVFVLDDNGHVIDCNSRAEEIFGYSSDDVWNVPIDRLVYGMNNRMFNLLRKNLGNKRHILIDARCFRSNGSSFLAEVGVSTVQLTRSENVVFAIRNVERRKDSAEELRKMRAALDILPFPAFTCNLHGEFEVFNPPVLKALGMVDEMEAQKKHFSEMLPDMVEFFQAAVRGEEVLESRPLTRPDGSSYTMELRLKPMRRGQEIIGVAGTMSMF